jgi:DNA-binding transcriptional MerR regulator
MDLVNIGEFARETRLSPKALRLYDELGLLPPARVDPDSGYRWYSNDQVERARLVARLRRIGLSLRQIRDITRLCPDEAAAAITARWTEIESDHVARRELASLLVDQLRGMRTEMYDIALRDMPARKLLCLNRHAHSDQLMDIGKGFIAKFREMPGGTPRLDGIAGAPFVIYYGEVSQDSDGPIEWCWPVPDGRAGAIASTLPDLTLRTESPHREAYIHLDSAIGAERHWPSILESLTAWGAEQGHQPSGGIRQIFINKGRAEAEGPACDFAVSLR